MAMLLPTLSLLFGTVFWALTLLPEPYRLHGVTWPNLFFADQPIPLWQIVHSIFEIGAMLLLTSGLLLILRRRRWSKAQISAMGVILSLLSLAGFSLWASAPSSALFVVFLVGLGLASSPWIDGPLGRPPRPQVSSSQRQR
ncbi:hypothetical protein [Deinococcus gobiensis]|uniref:Uncharacterized protein n=1 Tax=Deinococcus gobiensis (strain DSM 21396 / JCM 16679 / CGMCC 1.7299 / I-0) TaxID=745776 RepID=H8H361_DEIGI|nr:hypothetical protein [Deinococcus gobiensis]AFD27958.1 hypothetical protein DGo_PC0166 [Deinococcus gobiensis I-0]